jgi:hypothetical protein
VSLDGGGRWMRWTHGLPTVPVMDLAIHPRDHDLVIATHGRGLYILDDLAPLRTLSAGVLREPIHLFPTPDARQHALRPEDGGFALGLSEYRGENRPYGALLTWSLHASGLPLPNEEKERERKEKERAEKRTTSGEDQPAVETAGDETAAGQAPQVEIRITDAAGRLVRHFEVPARLGVQRTAWDLRRDEPLQLPQDPRKPPLQDPAGPELPPGTYGIVVQLGEHAAHGSVRVLPDPRSANTEADWQTREAAIQRAGALRDRLVQAVQRVRDARSDLDLALDRIRRKHEEKDGDGEAEAPVQSLRPFQTAATALRSRLTALERQLWLPYDTVGLQEDDSLVGRLFEAQSYLTSSWEPPSPNHMEYLRQVEADAEKAFAVLDRFFAADVAAFRLQAREAGSCMLDPVCPSSF